MGVWSCCKGVNSRYLPLDKFANQQGLVTSVSQRVVYRFRHHRNHRTRAVGTHSKAQHSAHGKVYFTYLAVNAALMLRRSASRTARCGATRRRIRTEDGHQPPCAHTARLSNPLLLAVGAETRGGANMVCLGHPGPADVKSHKICFTLFLSGHSLATSCASGLLLEPSETAEPYFSSVFDRVCVLSPS